MFWCQVDSPSLSSVYKTPNGKISLMILNIIYVNNFENACRRGAGEAVECLLRRDFRARPGEEAGAQQFVLFSKIFKLINLIRLFSKQQIVQARIGEDTL